jgi:hypothetical protein
VSTPRQHQYYKCSPCKEAYCMFCDGGLLYCTVCKQAERELEKECPGRPVKRLPAKVIRDIDLKNHARRLANLAPIRIMIRSCIRCGELFESAGNRTCGCKHNMSVDPASPPK